MSKTDHRNSSAEADARDISRNSAPVGMLIRGLSLLLEIGERPEGIGLTDLARACHLPISTSHRLLADLEGLGFVSFDSTGSRRYSLGLAVFKMSHQVAASLSLTDVARPAMEEATRVTGETSLLAVLDGTEIVYIDRVDSTQRVQIAARIGRTGPAHCTSMGKVLLAFQPDETRDRLVLKMRLQRFTANTITTRRELRRELERVRQTGFAIADEEYDVGIRAVAVPILDSRGRPAAAICVSTPAFRTPVEKLETYVSPLKEAAAIIGVQLTGASPDAR